MINILYITTCVIPVNPSLLPSVPTSCLYILFAYMWKECMQMSGLLTLP